MESYRNFNIASYMYAYYVKDVTDDEIRRGIERYLKYVPLSKIYVENHRSMTDVPVERLRQIRDIIAEYGITPSGGITSTVLVNGIQKPALYDTFCYTDPAHREEYLRIVREVASVFDEIILDDFFFTSCRCEMCIRAKGKKSWKDFRQEQMAEFSREIVDEAHRVNPKMNFIIKYPNWYESYHECGYNPSLQHTIFDSIYTGTETREPFYAAQHLQRYESYSLMRLLERTAPGQNGGGWIDLGGSSDNISRFLEQAELSFLGGAKELVLFNFMSVMNTTVLPALDPLLRRVDAFLDETGRPCGTAVWEPFDADGEDQLISYLGMTGAALEPSTEFDPKQPVVLFTQRTACVPGVMETLEAYVREGGKAIVTTGFLHETYEKGIKEMTSVRLTHRHVMGDQYLIDRTDYEYSNMRVVRGPQKVMFEALDYKTNATWADLLLLSGEDNFPVLTTDLYGKGRLLILNIPENFADLYQLPAEIITVINSELSDGQPLYLASEPKNILMTYENGRIAVLSQRPMTAEVRIVVRGENKGVRNLETGKVFTDPVRLPDPLKRQDAALSKIQDPEFAYDLVISPGQTLFLEVLR